MFVELPALSWWPPENSRGGPIAANLHPWLSSDLAILNVARTSEHATYSLNTPFVCDGRACVAASLLKVSVDNDNCEDLMLLHIVR